MAGEGRGDGVMRISADSGGLLPVEMGEPCPYPPIIEYSPHRSADRWRFGLVLRHTRALAAVTPHADPGRLDDDLATRFSALVAYEQHPKSIPLVFRPPKGAI